MKVKKHFNCQLNKSYILSNSKCLILCLFYKPKGSFTRAQLYPVALLLNNDFSLFLFANCQSLLYFCRIYCNKMGYSFIYTYLLTQKCSWNWSWRGCISEAHPSPQFLKFLGHYNSKNIHKKGGTRKTLETQELNTKQNIFVPEEKDISSLE